MSPLTSGKSRADDSLLHKRVLLTHTLPGICMPAPSLTGQGSGPCAGNLAWKTQPRIPRLPSYLMGAHLVDLTPREVGWGLSGSSSILDRFVEGQQGETELVLEQKEINQLRSNDKTRPGTKAPRQPPLLYPKQKNQPSQSV